ncbi:MAG: Rpn family recombination-promoting nuclease/putative transposase [Azoarcus sp.]|jgi:predicted transposase/invertase (TIGR01784 family)|nr:Rpn family recombination-promoting nuclease/putative transposase [Azoarcus sp.]
MTTAILPPKNDEVFKMLFGDEHDTELLIGFLRAVLPLPDDDYEELTLKNPFLPSEILNDKNGILDVLVQTKSGRQIDIEIQVANHMTFKSRVLYYLSRIFTRQIGEGDAYHQLKPVIGIVITDFFWIEDSEAYHNAYYLYDKKSGSIFSDDLSLHTLELPKVGKKDEHTDLWAWLEFLKAKNEEELEMLIKEHPVVQPAVTKLVRLSASEEARAIFEARERARREALTWQYEAKIREAQGREEGEKKGREEGREEGEKNAQLVIARKALGKNMPIEDIVELTGLSAAEILALRVH